MLTKIYNQIKKKYSEKKIISLFIFFHVYCLILAWLNGGEKIKRPWVYTSMFLIWWCTWNSLLTIVYSIWKKNKNPDPDSLKNNLLFFAVALSNLVTAIIYGLGLLIWMISGLTYLVGISGATYKFVPIPNHTSGLIKVIHWWTYSPLWHVIAPALFFEYFLDCCRTQLLWKEKKKLTAVVFIQPTLYYLFLLFRIKISPKDHLESPFMKWPFGLFSAKKILNLLDAEKNYRFLYKIFLVLAWSIFFLFLTLILIRKKKLEKKEFFKV